MESEQNITIFIRAGFKASCLPAGTAEASVAGEMCIADAEDAAVMLEMTARNIRRQIAATINLRRQNAAIQSREPMTIE